MLNILDKAFREEFYSLCFYLIITGKIRGKDFNLSADRQACPKNLKIWTRFKKNIPKS